MAAKQITIRARNRPGSLAKICAAVGAAGVNLTGIYASDEKGGGTVRLLVANSARARAALRKAGFRATEEPAVVLTLRDRPGQLARTATKLARARVNIAYAYTTVSPGAKRATVVLGVRNAAAARRALRG